VDLGGSAQAASVGYPLGAIHFGPAWEDDSVQLTHKGWSQITDGMAKSIVRLECEADELRAEVAMLKQGMVMLAEERDEARKKAERYRLEANAMMAKLHELQAYADKLADGLPAGMLPRDVENLREANAGLADDLQKAEQERDDALNVLREINDWLNVAAMRPRSAITMNEVADAINIWGDKIRPILEATK
jgi:chromosome segregation ATPase